MVRGVPRTPGHDHHGPAGAGDADVRGRRVDDITCRGTYWRQVARDAVTELFTGIERQAAAPRPLQSRKGACWAPGRRTRRRVTCVTV